MGCLLYFRSLVSVQSKDLTNSLVIYTTVYYFAPYCQCSPFSLDSKFAKGFGAKSDISEGQTLCDCSWALFGSVSWFFEVFLPDSSSVGTRQITFDSFSVEWKWWAIRYKEIDRYFLFAFGFAFGLHFWIRQQCTRST